MDIRARRDRDLLIFGGLYPLIVAGVAWILGNGGAETGRLLVLVAGVGIVGLLAVLGFAGGPWAVAEAYRATAPTDPAPGEVRQSAFLVVTCILATLLAVVL